MSSTRQNMSQMNIIEEEAVSMGFGSYSQRDEPIVVEDLHYDEMSLSSRTLP